MGSLRRVTAICAVTVAVLTACGSADDSIDNPEATARIEITALAGPVCPVETDPPSPECAPRPVDAASIIVTDAEGAEVGRGTTGPGGTIGIDVPPGALNVVPQPVEGLLGTAPMISVTVTDGQTLEVTADYDTGIR